MTVYQSLEQMVVDAFEAVRPAERLSITEAAQRYHIIRSPGSHSGPWSLERTPYLKEPQDVLASLDYTGMAFVGPARTGKSAMFLNWLASTVVTDPSDMMVVHMARHTAREWSLSDLAKFFRNSPEILKRLRPGRNNDNTFDKEFTSGMRLVITWPTISNLSGKTIPRLWIMDYDRIDDDIDNEGNAFDLTRKRAQTFKRFGMCVAESSPGREVENPKWIRRTPHEAPPTKGILEIYNRGDRRRYQWACPQCHDAFEASFEMLSYPDSVDPMEAAEQVVLVCPHCGFPIPPAMKDELNFGGRWVRDGMMWVPETNEMLVRNGLRPLRSDIASFWLKGPAAGYQDWSGLVLNYLRAVETYESTGDEKPLQTTTNVDQGEPYTPKARISERLPEELRARVEHWGSTEAVPTVPEGVRFLISTVDVQARSFVVQVHGFTADGDVVVIDGFKIRKSNRFDPTGERQTVDPAGYPEDWDLLTEQVILRTYPLSDGSGRRMGVRVVGCDSGGREGVTANAYAHWRLLRAGPLGLHRRFALLKGDGVVTRPRAQVTWPDAGRRDKLTAARGDVPVVRLNSNQLKDQIAAMLGRRVSEEGVGGGMIRFPHWTPDWWYTQVTTETKGPKGWENPAQKRNEAWDLLYYALGLAVRPADATCPLATIAFDRIRWDNPPLWAEEWDQNDMVATPDAAPSTEGRKKRRSFADLGQDLT